LWDGDFQENAAKAGQAAGFADQRGKQGVSHSTTACLRRYENTPDVSLVMKLLRFLSVASDPATIFKSGSAQMAQKTRRDPLAVNIAKGQEIPLQGGKNYFLFGDTDAHDGQGAQSLVVQMILTPPQQMGTWQMTVF
jgi:hypothetical protein